MRFPRIMATTIAATLTLPMAAGAAAQTSAGDAGAQSSARQNAITDRYLTAVQVELTSRVDTANAVVGQEVIARTKDPATLADGTTLPKGTRLIGHVMQVRAGGREQGAAVLALVFDRAELKSGQSVAARTVLRAVAPGGNAPAADNGFPAPMAPTAPIAPIAPVANPTGSGAGPSVRTSTRGGVGLGGVDLPGANPPSVGGPIGRTGTAAGGTGPSLGGPLGSSIGGVAADPRSLGGTATGSQRVADAGERTSPTARPTAMPGVMLSNTAVANASGTLTAFGRNISLESGTQMTLGVITR